jgi:hypothetical protein
MARALAIGLSGATQVLTAGVTYWVLGTSEWPDLLGRLAGYVINLAIAEAWLRHESAHLPAPAKRSRRLDATPTATVG